MEMKITRKMKDLFDAEASSPYETATLHNGSVGFRIPEYQRQYDWSSENIKRLFSDCLSGFHRLGTSPNADAFTFLGTLILVEEDTKEEDFSGQSVAIVDGQQRLTTLTLIACSIYENLNDEMKRLKMMKINKNIKKWLELETEDRLADLMACAAGTQQLRGNKTYPYPRIVRVRDFRGRSVSTSEYHSPLAKFLEAFAKYGNDEFDQEFIPPSIGSGKDAQKLEENYNLVKEFIKSINVPVWYEEAECEQVPIDWIDRAGYKILFDRLADVFKNQSEQDKAISDIKKYGSMHNFVRTLLFASYFCRCIVLTRVTTDDERAAFAIFDALNTTGEPLTALETLKPRVMQFEELKGGFSGTNSDIAFQKLRENVDEQNTDSLKKQKDTKELVVSFALYMEGIKIPEHLAQQRQFLRSGYDKAKAISREQAQRFVSLLANMSEFRRFYWTSKGIEEELARFHSRQNLDQVQLLMSFIRSTNTKLVLPILARYWSYNIKNEEIDEYLQALKAVTAFLVLRRAASGVTAGIDADFRAIMAHKNGSARKFGLYAGIDNNNPRLSIEELKSAFRTLLAKSKFNIETKDRWVDQVVDNPLYRQIKTIVRFMLLVAAHQSTSSTQKLGCWEKEGIRTSPHTNNFLNYFTWNDKMYKTIEHIAPDTEPRSGWDQEIYKNNILRDSLGNLILLPINKNKAIGNTAWEKKKAFYLAVTEPRKDKLEERIDNAKTLGIHFSPYLIGELRKNNRLSLLDPLRDVQDWNRDVIVSRSRNIAELTWDYLWPWLE